MAKDGQEGLTIDLDQVVATKFKGKKLPPFVMRFLKRFIHQDWINENMKFCRDGEGFYEDALKRLDVRIEVEGKERVPQDGTRYIFVSNHPLGGIDGLALTDFVQKNYGHTRLLVNDFLMNFKAVRPQSVAVNKTGSQSRDILQQLDEAYQSSDQMMIFPAGLCSRRIKGKVQDLPWTKTFITKSVESGRTVVPVHFIGENPARFYRADWFFRKFLKIQFNIPMLFLPDAMYHTQHKTFRVILGDPLPPGTFDKSRKPAEWAAWVREKVYQLN
jgi:1-acyl-sn-glycerol-3-phosphate acyltransferase